LTCLDRNTILVAHPEVIELCLDPLAVGFTGFGPARWPPAGNELSSDPDRHAGLHKSRGGVPIAPNPNMVDALLLHGGHHLGYSLAFLAIVAVDIHIEGADTNRAKTGNPHK
jgi:hypothetical protein